MPCLYKLTSPSGKSYIGISMNGLESRWNKHVEHALGKRPGALYAAMRKYGHHTFSRAVLAEEDNWDRLCDMEVAAIREHGTKVPHGYNMTLGGEGHVGPMSDESKARMSEAQKKRYQREDERARLCACARKAGEASHARAVVRKAIKKAEREAYLASPEFKRMHSDATRAAMARPDVAAKVNQCARDRSASPHWRAKVSASKTGKKVAPCSEQRKQRIAEARRREWADPVIRARRLAAFAAARRKVW